jgi:hypothetical protein
MLNLKIRTMKKQLFTLVILLMLVAVTNKMFAQSTPLQPWEGAIHTYTVNGMTSGNSYEFGVNTTAGDYTNGGSFYNITTSASGTVGSDGRASVAIEWQAGAAAAGNYYVWIRITDSDNCHTYRALLVDPQPASTDPYDVNFGIVALQTGDDETDPVTLINLAGSTSETSCPAFVDENWVLTTLSATGSDGYSYVYFRIRRTSAMWPSTTWAITPTAVGAATNWEYSYSPATAFAAFTSGSAITGINTGNDIYLRARVTNGTSSQAITVSIANGDDTANAFNNAATHVEPSATLTVLPVPAVGSFSDSN